MATLRSKITLLEAQLESERAKARNLQEERDEAVKAMGAYSEELDNLKSDNKALRAEIVNLKRQIHETLKQTQTHTQKQKPTTTAKERVKEQIEAERKREHAHKARVDREKEDEGNRSFIRVFHLQLN